MKKNLLGVPTTIFLLAIYLSLTIWVTDSNAEDYPEPQCPPKKTDNAFIPCGAKFLAPKAVGEKLVEYKGQELPSDGPLIDMLSDKWALKSKDGLLEAEMNYVSGTAENPMLVGSKPYKVITWSGPTRLGGVVSSYNGLYPNPTLFVQPGDTIKLNINDKRLPIDQLQDTSESFDPTDPVPLNSNIHYHGVLVSPTGFGDNVYRTFLPGNSYVSEVYIPPNHDRGINWYHAHFHTSTTAQVYGGFAGLIQIGDVVDTDKRNVYDGFKQRLLVLNGFNLTKSKKHPGMFELGPAAIGTSPEFSDPNPVAAQGGKSEAPSYGPMYFINGQVNPVIEMRPGETQILTFANFNPFAAYSLAILKFKEDGQVDTEAPLFKSTLIAQDGNDQFTPTQTYFIKQRDPNKDTYVSPGQRMSWAVTAPEKPGVYYLVNVVDSDYTNQVSNLPSMVTFEPPDSYVPSVIMATVKVEGDPSDRPAPSVEAEPPPVDLDGEPILTRNIAFDFDEHSLTGRINFGHFPDVAMAQSYSGDDERWVVSTFSQVSHPFHIHQGQFVVEKIEYYEDQELTKLRTDLPENPVINDVPRNIDTMAFPGRSKTYIRLDASDYIGKFVMHCHLLLHEDSGMMVTVKVSPSRDASISAVGDMAGNSVTLARSTTEEIKETFKAYEDSYKGGVDAEEGHIVLVKHLGFSGYDSHVVTAKKKGKPQIRVFDTQNENKMVFEFRPFEGKGDGGSVALGDIDGDSADEIVVGSGKGHTPTVSVYDIVTSEDGTMKEKLVFTAPVLDDSYKEAGVNVASGDVDGDNWDDILVSHGPGSENRIMIMSGQEITLGKKPEDTIVIDNTGIIPGKSGLNIAADNLAGGYFQYPPVTELGRTPPAPNPYRAIVAVTPAASSENPTVNLFYYLGAGGHSHGEHAEHSELKDLSEFTPYPGEESGDGGLDLSTVLTIKTNPDNPLVGLVSSKDREDQKISYFNIEGEIETLPWAQQKK